MNKCRLLHYTNCRYTKVRQSTLTKIVFDLLLRSKQPQYAAQLHACPSSACSYSASHLIHRHVTHSHGPLAGPLAGPMAGSLAGPLDDLLKNKRPISTLQSQTITYIQSVTNMASTNIHCFKTIISLYIYIYIQVVGAPCGCRVPFKATTCGCFYYYSVLLYYICIIYILHT